MGFLPASLNMISHIHPIPAFDDNYIWLFANPAEKSACVVDPGEAAPVEEYLSRHGLQLTEILVTHHHADHVGGLARLIERYSPRVTGPESSGIKGISNYVLEGDSISVFDTAFSVIEVPGHTLDHIAYYSSNNGHPIVFCGDTLFAAGCGRLFEGTPQMMQQSLAKLTQLDQETALYCAHEYTLANLKFAVAADPNNAQLNARVTAEQAKRQADQPTLPSSIGLELATNPFLRCNLQSVQQNVALKTNTTQAGELETFTQLRRWKDNF
ncbi:MAG: hydroxyacylglutathione hydrolase [Pseudohongiellaceae bacterium]|jgi:hydroxyacylglutathione hydrolase